MIPTQDQAEEWAKLHGFTKKFPELSLWSHPDFVGGITDEQLFFIHTIYQKGQREAEFALCQRLIEENYTGTEIDWVALGCAVVNEKLKLIHQGVTPPQTTNQDKEQS